MAILPKWALRQGSALSISFAIVSNLPPDKGTSPAALLLLLLFDINAQSATTNAHSILMFDQRKAVFREMPLVHLIDW